jgi:Domain of unknown function (DUF222)
VEHPIVRACAAVTDALKDVAEVNPVFMSTEDKAGALQQLVRAEARLVELRLRVMAEGVDVAEATGAHSVAEWLTVHTRVRHEDARAEHRLALALDRRYAVLAAGLRHGDVTLAQAHVVVRALDDLPDDVPTDVLALAEQTLVGHAAEFGPRQLASLGRRILEVVAPEIVDKAEARRLAALEADARRRTRLSLRRLGNGTTRLSGLLPDAAATRLATYLDAFTNPRRQPDPSTAADPFGRLPHPRRLGQAFCQLLEAVDPMRLPLHGGDATTLVVTIDLASLRHDLGVAELLGSHLPGPPDTEALGQTTTAAEARRMACTAGIVPAVLGGDSEILDLGRSRRLFSAAQRRALRLRDRECRAEGCTIPAALCEAHHGADPRALGGRTDLSDGLLLCSQHHHRAHDPAYSTDRLANGTVRYHRRR